MSSQQELYQLAEESVARKLDAQDLYTFIDRFVSSNRNSPHVDDRWLAAYANDLKTMAYYAKTGNHDTIKKQVNDFRLCEIYQAKQKLDTEIEQLENEEAKLLREIEQIPEIGSEA